VVEFDGASGKLVVREILDIPQASRYGMNTINSTNSGNIFDMPGGELRSLGKHVGLWHDPLLSHEPIVLGPCCWVDGWTKVIGKSAQVHEDAAAMLMDLFATNLLPFSVSGLDGPSVTGQVTPGELFNGMMYKQRHPAWAFANAPSAVIGMVQRVAELSGDTVLADRLVELSLKSALALIRYNAHQREVDLAAAHAKMPKGWAGWLIQARDTLQRHLDSGLWQFSGGNPVQWEHTGDGWVPRNPELFKAVAGATTGALFVAAVPALRSGGTQVSPDSRNATASIADRGHSGCAIAGRAPRADAARVPAAHEVPEARTSGRVVLDRRLVRGDVACEAGRHAAPDGPRSKIATRHVVHGPSSAGG